MPTIGQLKLLVRLHGGQIKIDRRADHVGYKDIRATAPPGHWWINTEESVIYNFWLIGDPEDRERAADELIDCVSGGTEPIDGGYNPEDFEALQDEFAEGVDEFTETRDNDVPSVDNPCTLDDDEDPDIDDEFMAGDEEEEDQEDEDFDDFDYDYFDDDYFDDDDDAPYTDDFDDDEFLLL
jgi:hypothetical protein